MKYTPYFRIASIEETTRNTDQAKDVDQIIVKAVIIPYYEGGLPKESSNLKKDLIAFFEAQKDYLVNKTALIIRDLAVEIWTNADKSSRAEKLTNLKFVLLDFDRTFLEKEVMLEIFFTFKPMMYPVFENNFFHEAVIYSEPLLVKNEDG